MSEFKLQRLGIIMKPEDGDEMEIEGVLTPAAVRGKDGHLYLLYLMKPVILLMLSAWA
jgi:hypothetical protein